MAWEMKHIGLPQAVIVAFALGCGLTLAVIAGVRIIEHPLPTGWDETSYVNDVCAERFILAKDGLVRFAKSLIFLTPHIPPGYRIAAIPTFLLAPGPQILKAMAVVSLLLSAAILFFAIREIATFTAGVISSTFCALSAGTFMAEMYFGTETTLYPAVAGCIYAVARLLRKGELDFSTWAVVVLSTSTGALSKASFLVIIAPLASATVGLMLVGGRVRSSIQYISGLSCGLLIGAPWWVSNWANAVEYAKNASEYSRHSFPWASEAATQLFGIPFTLGVIALLVGHATQLPSLPKCQNEIRLSFVGVCLIATVPLTLLHLFGSNHNMRLLSPALIPLSGAMAVLLDGGWLRRWSFVAVAMPILIAQTLVIARMTFNGTQRDQWNWEEVRRIAVSRGLINPVIAHLGNGPAFNTPQIQYPWVCHGEPVRETWLWRYEDGSLDWTKLEDQLTSTEIVLTAPHYFGDEFDKDGLDNAHNDELARRLYERPEVWQSQSISLDKRGNTQILMFIRNSR
jgi:hypothetical protein